MPFEDTKILELINIKSDKASYVIHLNLECIIEKVDACINNTENLSTRKVDKHIPSGFSMSKKPSIRSKEHKDDVYINKVGMKKFCEDLREHAMKLIIFF